MKIKPRLDQVLSALIEKNLKIKVKYTQGCQRIFIMAILYPEISCITFFSRKERK
jgi:hypothetical protein